VNRPPDQRERLPLFGLGVAVLTVTFAALTALVAVAGHVADAILFALIGAVVVGSLVATRRFLATRSARQ
jgi:hypothetical protein